MSDIPVLERVLFSQEQLTKRAEELGRQISADYRGKQPLFVGILRGCILFYADLMKNISVDCNMDFMCLSSYAGGTPPPARCAPCWICAKALKAAMW